MPRKASLAGRGHDVEAYEGLPQRILTLRDLGSLCVLFRFARRRIFRNWDKASLQSAS
jgi:hypothetical protein